ncbi:unnamed protein product [Toxocara canis]|uniref:DUF4773 domain-containing protein n=1 Tax=Toxocara canis TaxID=6265 RepID=A0A183ULE6_TOXCA|nr:unnamed protein product [Toxocara canis]
MLNQVEQIGTQQAEQSALSRILAPMWVNLLSIVSALTITNARHAEQCRCLRKADGSCLPYDPRYMAMNLEEAMVSFPDLLLTNPPDPVDVQNPTPYSVSSLHCNSNCLTEECVSCQEDIRQRLTQVIEGTRFNISCVGKGMLIGDQGLISLCSSCWAWRRLPPNYMPRILNELICDNRDNACLSGTSYATCMEGLRNLEVIRNDSGTLTTVLLTSGTYCECRAKQQSPIYNLIVGSSANGNIPTL